MTKIIVTKLFGRFDYEFDMGDMSKSGIIILSGPNGFGKTVILECINAISTSDLSFFFNLNFKSFEVNRSETGFGIQIKKQNDELIVNGTKLSEKQLNYWGRDGRLKFLDGNDMEKLDIILKDMQKVFGNIRYIKEQRLIEVQSTETVVSRQNNRKSVQKILAVNNIQKKLEEQIRNLDSVYSQLSNELDRTFVKRLFELKEGISEAEFNEKINQVRKKVQKLNDSGISKMGTLDVTTFKKEDARALKIYFDDFDKKYQVYEKMIEQIELFKQIVNAHFRFKQLKITDKQSLEVIDNETKERIRLSYLSSGEQEILVLYYKLLFEIPEKKIVLIDEPEISLHIAWQRMFAQDLEKIVKLRNIFAVVATHSVQIVTGNRHIQYDLGEMYKNGLNQGKQN